MKNLYIKDPDTSSLENLIKNGYIDVYNRSSYKLFKETFSDKAMKKRQCHMARRSFEDLFRVANTYFPGTTEKELFEIIKKQPGMTLSYCGNIYKNVFFIDGNHTKMLNWTNGVKKGRGKWNLQMLEAL